MLFFYKNVNIVQFDFNNYPMKAAFKFILYIFLLNTQLIFSQAHGGVSKKLNIKKKSADQIKDDHQEYIESTLKYHIKLIGQMVYFSDHIGDFDQKKEEISKRKVLLDKDIDDEIVRLSSLKDIMDSTHLDSIKSFYNKAKVLVNTQYNLAITHRMNLKEMSHSELFQFISALNDADHELMKAESSLYELNKSYSRKHKIKLDKDFDELHKKVLKNDKVITYHNKMLLQFYHVFDFEQDSIINEKSTGKTKNVTGNRIRAKDDTIHTEQFKNFANKMFYAEDTVNTLGVFEGDGTFSFAVKEYFKYLRNQYFDNFTFYTQYMANVEKKRLENAKNKKNTKVDNNNKQQEQRLRAAQSKLRESYRNMSEQRGDIVSYIEEAGFDFLYTHCPEFKR